MSHSSPSQGAELPDALVAFLARADRAPVSVEPLLGDASTRRYFRLRAADGSTRLLALHSDPFDPAALPFLAVRGLLSEFGLPVPEILEVDGAHGILVEEDLGDMSLLRALESAGEAERDAHYREALDQLVRLQRAARADPREMDCFALAFDAEKLGFELDFFLSHFVRGLRQAVPSEAELASLREGFGRLSEEIASWPRVLCHRDFHSRNLMLRRGILHWIDFQDARMGPATYDLASLLRDSYVAVPEEAAAELGERFRRAAVPEEPQAMFAHRLELVSIQRNLKALGTFGFMATVRGNLHYVQYVARTLASARRNLSRHAELDGLRRVLARHIEELA
jgi:aminoglycoside/choline kinase family phosphotransferase